MLMLTSYTFVYFVIRYLIWITAYFTLSFVYRFALDNNQRRAFEVMYFILIVAMILLNLLYSLFIDICSIL